MPPGLVAAAGEVPVPGSVVPTVLIVCSFLDCGAPEAGVHAASITIAAMQARWQVGRAAENMRAQGGAARGRWPTMPDRNVSDRPTLSSTALPFLGHATAPLFP